MGKLADEINEMHHQISTNDQLDYIVDFINNLDNLYDLCEVLCDDVNIKHEHTSINPFPYKIDTCYRIKDTYEILKTEDNTYVIGTYILNKRLCGNAIPDHQISVVYNELKEAYDVIKELYNKKELNHG